MADPSQKPCTIFDGRENRLSLLQVGYHRVEITFWHIHSRLLLRLTSGIQSSSFFCFLGSRPPGRRARWHFSVLRHELVACRKIWWLGLTFSSNHCNEKQMKAPLTHVLAHMYISLCDYAVALHTLQRNPVRSPGRGIIRHFASKHCTTCSRERCTSLFSLSAHCCAC